MHTNNSFSRQSGAAFPGKIAALLLTALAFAAVSIGACSGEQAGETATDAGAEAPQGTTQLTSAPADESATIGTVWYNRALQGAYSMPSDPISIKRYPNRRYYARNTSKYVSLKEIEEMALLRKYPGMFEVLRNQGRIPAGIKGGRNI